VLHSSYDAVSDTLTVISLSIVWLLYLETKNKKILQDNIHHSPWWFRFYVFVILNIPFWRWYCGTFNCLLLSSTQISWTYLEEKPDDFPLLMYCISRPGILTPSWVVSYFLEVIFGHNSYRFHFSQWISIWVLISTCQLISKHFPLHSFTLILRSGLNLAASSPKMGLIRSCSLMNSPWLLDRNSHCFSG